jgi:hypothetical protein
VTVGGGHGGRRARVYQMSRGMSGEGMMSGEQRSGKVNMVRKERCQSTTKAQRRKRRSFFLFKRKFFVVIHNLFRVVQCMHARSEAPSFHQSRGTRGDTKNNNNNNNKNQLSFADICFAQYEGELHKNYALAQKRAHMSKCQNSRNKTR